MNHRVLGAIAMVGVVALAAACGGNDDDGDGAAATPDSLGVVEIAAKNLKFVPDKITIRAGEMVELRMMSEDGQEHDLQVAGLEVEVMEGGATGAEHQMATPMPGMETPAKDMETPGQGESPSGEMGPIAMHTTADGEDSITFIATEKGKYEFWCTISDHKEAGMVGTLTVE